MWDPATGKPRPREEWDNPSTLANPDNVLLESYRGKDAMTRKYGPAVLGTPEEQAAARAAAAAPVPEGEPLTHEDVIAPRPGSRRARELEAIAAAAQAPASADDLPVLNTRAINPDFGKEMPAPPPVVAPNPTGQGFERDHEQVIETIKQLGPKAQHGDAAATAELTVLAEREWARPSGPRTPIMKRLAAFGIKRPETA